MLEGLHRLDNPQRRPSHRAHGAGHSVWPYGRLDWQYEYRDDDHDDGEKTFLGRQGAFDGEDVIDIICEQPATARFISRHLYNYFVADEPQVPAWDTVPPRDPDAIDTLVDCYFESGGDIRAMLRTLFNSDFFKSAQFAKVKSPAEMVVGAARQSGGFAFPEVEDIQLALETGNMGQLLVDPPSVEGWHTGHEWVTTASLVNRVNFAVKQFADETKPGVRSIIERVQARGAGLTPEQLVDSCLEIMGPMDVSPRTREQLVAHASDTNGGGESAERVKALLQLIVATREYQMA